MKAIRLIAVAALIASYAIAVERNYDVDAWSLAGKTSSELKSVFPGLGDVTKEWQMIGVEGWKGWDKVWLNFNKEMKLSHITFSPKKTLSVKDSVQILKDKLGVNVSTARRELSMAAIRFVDLVGPVKQANLVFDRGSDTEIAEIAIFYR